jgi:hypothetical protein
MRFVPRLCVTRTCETLHLVTMRLEKKGRISVLLESCGTIFKIFNSTVDLRWQTWGAYRSCGREGYNCIADIG